MRLLSILAIVGVFFGAVSAHGDHGHSHDHDHEDTASGDSSVVVLSASSFDAFVGDNELSLVEFFAPWCGHCKQLAPQYEIAAAQLVGTAALGSVDCTVEKDLCSKYDVKGFPTLKVFRKGSDTPSEYGAGRQADDIVKFMRKQNAPAYIEAKQDEIEGLVTRDGVVVVGYFADKDAAKDFLAAAQTMRNDYSFVLVTESVSGVSAPAVRLYKAGEVETFDGTDFSTEKIQPFVVANAFPLVGEIGPENFQKYVERGFPLVWVFLDYNSDATPAILTAATNVAKDFKGRLSVVKLDGVRWSEHSKNFGLSGTPPGIVLEDRTSNKNYVLPQANEITEQALRTHLQSFVDGTLAPTVKSEEIPATQDGPVYVLVGKAFESVVMDETKDVLVEFYAPWCGHCKTLAPKYDILGEEFKSNPNVIIAKIDATANDTPTDVQGFPTIIFWPANNKKSPITYEGERTETALAAFVRENGSTFGNKAASTESTDDGKDEL